MPSKKTDRPGRPPPPRGSKLGGKTTPSASGSATSFDGAVDQRRVKDVSSARDLFNRLVLDNSQRSQTFAYVRNQLEGGRPFDPNLLRSQGATWQTNVNFRDAEAARNRTLIPYWKMVNDVPHKIAVTIRSNSPQSSKWEVSFAEAFDDFLTDWGSGYQIEFMNFASNFVNFGPGIVQWREKTDPRYSAVNVQRIYFPKNGRMSPDEWDVVALVADVSPSELYIKVKDKQSKGRSKFLGWNIDAVEAAIAEFKDGGSMPDPYDYTRWQDMMVNNDIYYSSRFQPLQLVWMYVRGFDGKIQARCFSRMAGVEEFLFLDDNYSENFRHILGPVWYDTGTDSMIHSIKGFAVKNFHFSALINRTKSRFVDGATFSFGLNFQRSDNNMPDDAPPVENYGPCSIFPSGMTQLTVYPQTQQAESVITMLENNEAQNNALYREQTQQIQETDTATQAKLLASMQGELSEASASLFLSQYGDNVSTEQVRRLRMRGNQNEDAKKFVQRLKDLGVPDDVIHDKPIIIKTGANAGMANPALRTMAFQEGLALSKLPGVNAQWFLENFIANKYGSQSVSKALLPQGAQSNPAQRRQAKMENQDFGQGQQLEVAPEDDHAVHIEEHMQPMEAIAGAFQQNGTIGPEQTMALTIGVEHTGQHLGYLAQDETSKDAFQQLSPRFRQVQSITRGILTRLQQQKNGQQNGPSPLARTG